MRFECRYSYHPAPCEPCEFLEELTIDVVCMSGDSEEVVAGRMALDHLNIDRAINAHEDIYMICDSDSAGWEHVFAELFEPGTQAEWREDFRFDEPISHLLFLHNAVFHPALLSWQSFIIHNVANLYGDSAALVMWKGETDLSEQQLRDLGFWIIAGSELYMRANMLQHNYSPEQDETELFTLEVPNNAGEYVENNWKED